MKKVLAIGVISFSLFVQSADQFSQWNNDVDAGLAAAGGLVQLISDFVAENGAEFMTHFVDNNNEPNFVDCNIQ